MKKVKSSFKGKVAGASERSAKAAFSYGYLKLSQEVQVFSPVPGKTVTLDFMPYEVTMKNHPDKYEQEEIAVPGTLWYRLPFKVHRNIGTKKDSVVCLQSFGKKCPICEYRAKRQKEGADKDELAALRASDRNLYIVNPLDSDKFDAGKFHIFDISTFMFQKLLDEELKEESIPEDFMDPFEGVSLKIRFSSETIGTSKPFAEAKKITPIDRKKQYKESTLETIPNLDEMLTIMTYDELEAKFFEIDTEDEEDAPKAKKSSKKVVEEDDEDEAPIRKQKAAKKAVVEDDEDEDEDEEEEVKPARKKKPAPVEEEEDDEDEEEEEDATLTWDEISIMKEKELKNLIKANKLDTDPDDYDDDIKSFRKAVAKEMGIKIPKTTPTPAPIAKKDRCSACNGTGKNSKGGVCKTCMGTGIKQAEDDEEEEEEVPIKKEKSAPAKKVASDECPHGHVFGKDTDKKPECDSCDLWDGCMAAKTKKR